MVDAGSTIGLFEVGSLAETQDFADAAQFQPELREQHGASSRQRAYPGHAGQRDLDLVRRAVRRRDLGPGMPDRLNGWVPASWSSPISVALNVTIPTYIPASPDASDPVRDRTGLARAPAARRRQRGT